MHRDIKPENVLVDKDGRTLLGDLGLAGFMDQGTCSGAVGTWPFAAPEVLDPKIPSYTKSADW